MPAFVASAAPGAGLRQQCAWTGVSLRSRPRALFLSGGGPRLAPRVSPPRRPDATRRTVPAAVLGGGGFLGVGPAEVVVIAAVGWLLLGPEKLYALARDSGKILGQLRGSADEARNTFKEALDLEVLEAEFKDAAKEGEQMAATKAAAAAEADAPETTTADGATEPEADVAAGSTELDDAGLADILREDAPVAAQEAVAEAEMEPLAKAGPPADAAMSPTFLDQLRRVADAEQVAPSEADALEDEIEQNATFLDQLRRASDPGQTAPSETGEARPVGADVPQEISMDEGATEEQKEVERLERQYIEARRRLEERQRKRGDSDASEN